MPSPALPPNPNNDDSKFGPDIREKELLRKATEIKGAGGVEFLNITPGVDLVVRAPNWAEEYWNFCFEAVPCHFWALRRNQELRAQGLTTRDYYEVPLPGGSFAAANAEYGQFLRGKELSPSCSQELWNSYKAQNNFRAHHYNPEFYVSTIDALTGRPNDPEACTKLYAGAFRVLKTWAEEGSLKFSNQYLIYTMRYGVSGTYLHWDHSARDGGFMPLASVSDGRVVIGAEEPIRYGGWQLPRRAVHEIIHLGIQPLINEFRVEDNQKERIIDLLTDRALAGSGYATQPVGDPTANHWIYAFLSEMDNPRRAPRVGQCSLRRHLADMRRFLDGAA